VGRIEFLASDVYAQENSGRLRLTFTINNRTGRDESYRPRIKDAFGFKLREVVIGYADDTWKELKTTLARRIKEDVQREIGHMAFAYRQSIIGAGKTLRGPSKRFYNTKMPGGPSFQPSQSVPPWEPRRKDYLSWKRRKGLTENWFQASGMLGAMMARQGTWSAIFGPIRVDVRRWKNSARGANSEKVNISLNGGYTRVGIAVVSVKALENITPEMLQISGDTPNRALLGLVHSKFPGVAQRLWSGRGPYRPTLEPFLTFVLTQAAPHAVQQRIAKGLFGSWDGTGSGGRTR
jgi:hypothetical protein